MINCLKTTGLLLGGILSAFILGCEDPEKANNEAAEAQTRRIAEDLDRRTTETGVYIRVKDGEINEQDPWGTLVRVSYSQGGVAEIVSVRSGGPDRAFHTSDDLVTEHSTTNLKGVGEGIKKNAEETAANTAKGLVKGTAQGVKESVKDALPFKKRNKPDEKHPQDDRKPGADI